jgi:hypothetical protein
MEPSVRGYNWVTLILGDVYGEIALQIGESQMRQKYMVTGPGLLILGINCSSNYRPSSGHEPQNGARHLDELVD